jgi:hypothetical protein
MSSAVMVKGLNALEEQPWGGCHGGAGIDQRGLARHLKAYGVEPKLIKLPDGSVARGYLREMFVDSWARYLREGTVTTATSVTQTRIQVTAVTEVTPADGTEDDVNLDDFELALGVGR